MSFLLPIDCVADMKKSKSVAAFILLIAIGIVSDQLAKGIALQTATAVLNTGVALSFLTGNAELSILVSVGGLLLVCYLLYDAVSSQQMHFYEYVPYALIFAGGISNLLDRFLYGGVVDFIRIGNFPTFNPADAMIGTGIVLLILIALQHEYFAKRTDNSAGSKRQTP